MRLGQLSRKLDIKPTEIREFIRNTYKIEIDLDLNTRIEDAHADAISAKFEKKPEPVLEIKKTEAPKIAEVETAPAKEVVEDEPIHVIHAPIEVPHYHEISKHDSTTAEPEKEVTEEPVNTTSSTSNNKDPFIPLPVDPDAEVIKVPKIKLEGLKVVGKIALPEKKIAQPVAEEIAAETESVIAEDGEVQTIIQSSETVQEPAVIAKADNSNRVKKDRHSKPVVQQNNDDEEYSIFKDKRGIYHFSQTQRENRKNSFERLKLEKVEDLRKQKKIKHYQQIVESEKKVESPKVKAKKQAQKESKKQPEKPQRKGVWGKFLNWLNG